MSSNPQSTGGGDVQYKVKAGDTLNGIAKQHGVTLKAILAANPKIKNPNEIRVGQSITIPSPLVQHPPPPAVTPVVAPVVTPVAAPAGTPVASGAGAATGVATLPTAAPPAVVTTDSAAFAAMDKRGKAKKLHPIFRERLALLAATLARRGMQALITDGLRTFEEQDALFAQGRTKPGPVVTKARGGQSNHNYGLAVDMYPVINGKVFTDVPKSASVEFRRTFHQVQDAIGEAAEALGLFWGARFSGIADTPHIQLLAQQDLSPAECLKIFNRNGRSLDAVWAEASRRVKPLSA
jgi:hypothetical protein